MPNTRASTRRLASKRKPREDTVANPVWNVQEQIEAETKLSITDNLREVESGVEKLYTRIRSLERETKGLRLGLQQVHQSVHVSGSAGTRSSGPREKAFRREIQSLKRAIVVLKAAREKDRRAIEKLRDKEVEWDAKLADDYDGATPTQQTVHLGESAIKLLRRKCDTIDMNTLAEGEECAICMEEMRVNECYSLPCQHPLCIGCFERLCDGANAPLNAQPEISDSSIQCPHCRDICDRDECEVITHTAVQQWDLLLDISRLWAVMDISEMDVRGDDDDSVAVMESSHLLETLEEVADLDPEISVTSSADDIGPVASYGSLPSPLKRKRLTELIAQRSVKPRS